MVFGAGPSGHLTRQRYISTSFAWCTQMQNIILLYVCVTLNLQDPFGLQNRMLPQRPSSLPARLKIH